MSLKQCLPLGRRFSLGCISRTNNTHGFCRLFSTTNQSLSTVTELISKQHWSSLKLLLQASDPKSLLHDLLDSGAKPELILSYFTWSQKELNLNYPLEDTFGVLHSLAYAKSWPKIRSFLHYFVRNEKHSVSSILHSLSISSGSCQVSSVIVDMLVLAYVNNLKSQLGFEAFKRAGDYGFRFSALSCNPLLNALVKDGESGRVEFMYREMGKRSIELNLITFNIVINGLCKAGKLQKARDVFEDMKLRVSPNAITYNSLIDGYCKMDKVGKMYTACRIFKEMKDNGIPPNLVTYNILIDGFCNDDNVSAAMKVFAEMQRLGLKPNVITYNALINGLCSSGKVDEALGFRDQMVGSGVEPNVVTHNVLINGFCKNKMLKEASELFEDMEKQGIAPNVTTYNTLIDTFCKNGEMEQAFSLRVLMLKKMVSPNVSTYNCLISGLCREGKAEDVKYFLEDMKCKHLRPDVVTYNILIDSLCKKGESRKAAKLLDEMIRKRH
ncbi:Pentatricopeptide repeat-containing protein At1g09820 [Linum grandiflorum]